MSEHRAFCVDEPSEPHLDAAGDCCCLGACCDKSGSCICPECNGGCGDH